MLPIKVKFYHHLVNKHFFINCVDADNMFAICIKMDIY